MDLNNKIDIIIPVYNVKTEYLHQCLSSIAIQNIVQDIEVTIVDDASSINYDSIIQIFNNIFPIQYIKLKENQGPGVARQTGIDNTNNEYICFMDSDDILYDYESLCILRQEAIKDYTSPLINSYFIYFTDSYAEYKNNIISQIDMSHVFGKLYRRSFIEEYNIHFSNTKLNEDIGFNAMVEIFCGRENMISISKNTYVWRPNENSITRANNSEYKKVLDDNSNMATYYKNIENAIKYVYTYSKTDYLDRIIHLSHNALTLGYWHYMMYNTKEERNCILKYANEFFNNIYIDLIQYISSDIVYEDFNDLTAFYYEQNYIPKSTIVSISFSDFMNLVQTYEETL